MGSTSQPPLPANVVRFSPSMVISLEPAAGLESSLSIGLLNPPHLHSPRPFWSDKSTAWCSCGAMSGTCLPVQNKTKHLKNIFCYLSAMQPPKSYSQQIAKCGKSPPPIIYPQRCGFPGCSFGSPGLRAYMDPIKGDCGVFPLNVPSFGGVYRF